VTTSLQEHTHRRPGPEQMARPVLQFDLASEIEQLLREPEWTMGRNARTLVKYDDLRVVLIVLRAGARIPGHLTDGRISIHTVRGHIRVQVQEETCNLVAGALLALDHRVLHDVEAVDDSAFLLTIAWPAQSSPRSRK
jgi:quercetin dioxygenase-like cupin family protein